MTYILQFNLQNLQICLKSLINQWLASYSFCTVSFLIYTLLVFWWLSLLPPHLLRNNVHIKKQQPRLDMKNITVLAIVIAVAFISGVTSAVVVSKLNQKAEEITSKLEEIDSRRNAQYGIMKSCIANPKKCEGK
jgi:outer membrane murein-binding lipoprotein Lpp